MSPMRALRLAAEKTAAEAFSLALTVQGAGRSSTDHAGLLAQIPDGLLLLLLDGPAGAVGVMTLDMNLLAALIEMQTVGQVLSRMPPPRMLTRTDAAMAAPLVDGILQRMTQHLAEHPERYWTSHFRFGAMIEDRRSLGLTLAAPDFHILRLDLDIADGLRQGGIMLILPAIDDPATLQPDHGADRPAEDLQARVLDAPVRLDAVLCRLSLPLSGIGQLAVGDLLHLPSEALREIAVEGVGGRRVATGRLGKVDGLRAVRLNLPALTPQGFDPIAPAPEEGEGQGHLAIAAEAAPAPAAWQPAAFDSALADPGAEPGLTMDDPDGLSPMGQFALPDDLADLSAYGFDPGPEAA